MKYHYHENLFYELKNTISYFERIMIIINKTDHKIKSICDMEDAPKIVRSYAFKEFKKIINETNFKNETIESKNGRN